MARKVTLEQLKEKLNGRPISLVDYAGSVTKKSLFRCLADGCDHEWMATTDNVIRARRGCPECARTAHKVKRGDIERELCGRNIELVEYTFGDMCKPATLRCTVDGCNHQWVATVGATRRGQGCRECWKRERGLTEPQVRAALLSRDIKLAEYHDSTSAIHRFTCLKDGHVWETNLGDVLRGQGCRKCAGLMRVTAEDVVRALQGRAIELLHYAGNTASKSRFRCLIDGHEWETSTLSVLHQESGCQVCAGNKPYTLEDAEKVAHENGCDLLEYGGGVNKRSLFRCHNDGYVWESTISNVRSSKSCPKCLNRGYMGDADVRAALDGRPIELLTYGGRVAAKSLFKCTVEGCGHEWRAASNVVMDGTGCPKCAGVLPLTMGEVEARIVGRPLKLLEYGGTVMARSKWQCDDCGQTWDAPADRVANTGTGCPSCALSGFRPERPATFYGYRFSVGGVEFFGFGITCDLKLRDYQHQRSFKAAGAKCELIFSCEGDGVDIQRFERMVKAGLPIRNAGVEGFKREAVVWDDTLVTGVLYEAASEFMVTRHSLHGSIDLIQP